MSMNIEDLTPEQRAKAMECKTAEELIELAEQSGVTLTEEQLDALSGGYDWGECTKNSCQTDSIW